ncbi:hypothetical protein SKAU_G00171100 [Synaphobranchus kaupii]|uniref:Uncharacterized protein n=1 Tax=Synaphobranchus kaupii TaxID=118154 RepID=A0A9Q1J0Q4_SYNKA|nr:hypothetical protein SKAU_G00171100 [Synaphobranchus kaupii]
MAAAQLVSGHAANDLDASQIYLSVCGTRLSTQAKVIEPGMDRPRPFYRQTDTEHINTASRSFTQLLKAPSATAVSERKEPVGKSLEIARETEGSVCQSQGDIQSPHMTAPSVANPCSCIYMQRVPGAQHVRSRCALVHLIGEGEAIKTTTGVSSFPEFGTHSCSILIISSQHLDLAGEILNEGPGSAHKRDATPLLRPAPRRTPPKTDVEHHNKPLINHKALPPNTGLLRSLPKALCLFILQLACRAALFLQEQAEHHLLSFFSAALYLSAVTFDAVNIQAEASKGLRSFCKLHMSFALNFM